MFVMKIPFVNWHESNGQKFKKIAVSWMRDERKENSFQICEIH